jgi:hypothetical protein
MSTYIWDLDGPIAEKVKRFEDNDTVIWSDKICGDGCLRGWMTNTGAAAGIGTTICMGMVTCGHHKNEYGNISWKGHGITRYGTVYWFSRSLG